MSKLCTALLALSPTLASAAPLDADKHEPPVVLDPSTFSITLMSHNNSGYGIKMRGRITGFATRHDSFRIDWKHGGAALATAKCQPEFADPPINIVSVDCTFDSKGLTAIGPLEGDLIYRDDGSDKEYRVTTFKVTAQKWKEMGKDVQWQIIPDDVLGAGWIDTDPLNAQSPNMLVFRFWAVRSTDLNVNGTLRCTVDGAKLDDVDAAIDSRDENLLIDISHPATKARLVYEHMRMSPLLHFGTKAAKKTNLTELIDHPGNWDCLLRADGKPIREFLFAVGDDGMIKPAAMQPPHLLPTVLMVDMRFPKGETFDAKIRPDAMKRSMGFGYPWPSHPQVKTMQAAFPPASGKDI